MPYKTVPAVPARIAAGLADSLEVFLAEAEQGREETAHLEPDLDLVAELKNPQREEALHRAQLRKLVANEGFRSS